VWSFPSSPFILFRRFLLRSGPPALYRPPPSEKEHAFDLLPLFASADFLFLCKELTAARRLLPFHFPVIIPPPFSVCVATLRRVPDEVMPSCNCPFLVSPNPLADAVDAPPVQIRCFDSSISLFSVAFPFHFFFFFPQDLLVDKADPDSEQKSGHPGSPPFDTPPPPPPPPPPPRPPLRWTGSTSVP